MRKLYYGFQSITLDEGILIGQAVFETICVLKKPLFLEEHLKRLQRNVDATQMPTLEVSLIIDFFAKYTIQNIVVKILVSPQNIIITERNIPYTMPIYERGMHLKRSSIKRNTSSMLTTIKSNNYLENFLEHKRVLLQGANDALFLNHKNHVAETTCANIFVVVESTIYTPSLECGLLPGIIRQWVIDRYPVIETSFSEDLLYNASEIFITNSLMGIMPITTYENKHFPIGSKTLSIMDEYKKYTVYHLP